MVGGAHLATRALRRPETSGPGIPTVLLGPGCEEKGPTWSEHRWALCVHSCPWSPLQQGSALEVQFSRESSSVTTWPHPVGGETSEWWGAVPVPTRGPQGVWMGLGEATLSWDAGGGKLFLTVSSWVLGFPAGDVSHCPHSLGRLHGA